VRATRLPSHLAPPVPPSQRSRARREAKEKKDAQERYWKLHEQGKTDQAKTDLARLAKIRAEREAASAQRKAETEGAFCTQPALVRSPG
jgi:hypothetical protein